MQSRTFEQIVASVFVWIAAAAPAHAQKNPAKTSPEKKAAEQKPLEPLSSRWKEVVPGRKVFANPDSIERIGDDTYRAVIVSDTYKDTRTIDTDEIRCGEHTSRRIRVREAGSRAVTSKRDLSFPDDRFLKIPTTPANNPADVKYKNVCAMAREKFRRT